MTINRRQLEILWLRAQEGDCWAQEQFQSFGLLIGIPFISIPKYMTVGEMPCHLPLNFLIDESHYPLPFSSLNETYSFSKEIRSRSINPAKTIDWLICGYYHAARRLDELAMKFGFAYRSFGFEYNTGLWGICYMEEKRIVINPVLLFLLPIIMDSVLIHELCHLSYHDHGDNFWALYNKLIVEIGVKPAEYGQITERKLLQNAGTTERDGRNDAKRLCTNVVTVSDEVKPKKRKMQGKAEYSRRTVCKSLPKKM